MPAPMMISLRNSSRAVDGVTESVRSRTTSPVVGSVVVAVVVATVADAIFFYSFLLFFSPPAASLLSGATINGLLSSVGG